MRPLFWTLAFAGFALAQQAPYGDISDLKLAKPEDKQDVKSTPPPKDAIVLFDGKSLDGWLKRDGKDKATWKLLDGGIMQAGGGDIRTEKTFDGHFKLHVEFRVPYMPTAKGQGRGNSGVYVQGRYEVQVLDSYGLKSQNNDCGGIYSVAAPAGQCLQGPDDLAKLRHRLHRPEVRKRQEGRTGPDHGPAQRHQDPRRREDHDRQYHGRHGRRSVQARPNHAARPRQSGAVPQHLAAAGEVSRDHGWQSRGDGSCALSTALIASAD